MKPNTTYPQVREYLLRNSPSTREQVQTALGGKLSAIHQAITRLHKEGRVHIGGWLLDQYGRPNTKLWKWGKGADVPRPLSKSALAKALAPLRDDKRIRPPGRGKQEVLAALELLGESTRYDLGVHCKMPDASAQVALNQLKADGLVHVSRWTRAENACAYARVWKLGAGEDAPRPGPAPRVRKAVGVTLGDRTPGLPMDYVIKSVFVGGKNPWTGVDVSQMRNRIGASTTERQL